MKKELDVCVSPDIAGNDAALKRFVSKQSGIPEKEISTIKVLKRGIDARSRNIKVNLRVAVLGFDEPLSEMHPLYIGRVYQNIKDKPPVLIVGAGPGGLFAALRLIELGMKPILIERGKDVRNRRKDLAAINKEHIVNPDSNYCFGEGGAGTYSDGKLYTRSTKRGDVNRVLSTFVAHGASDDILTETHPHIGTNKLPNIITAIRNTILNCGGEIFFNKRVTDIIVKEGKFSAVVTADGDQLEAKALIIATGHSASDIYELFARKGLLLEAKPFAMGVRVEHPQALIDGIRYHCGIGERHPYLPPASYNLTTQVDGRGVYSFCMCPGGIIAPCATQQGEVVTNGWSPSKRNNEFANSGLVVEVGEIGDIRGGALAGLHYRHQLETAACIAAGRNQTAPAQRLVDFVNGKLSMDLPKTSYQPGVASVALHDLLPKEISFRLQKALIDFGKTMKGYFTNEAILVGVETRTSSPVRIPRDSESLQHPQVVGLFPCGEGAGYAGGIVSAAIDGERCAEGVKQLLS